LSAFETLRRFLRPNDATVALPADPFIGIDRKRAAENLKLDERAKQNGERNLPTPDFDDFDEVELDIISEITEHARRAQLNASENHRIYSERLSQLALLRELSTITAASQTAFGDYRATIINRQGRLALAKEAIRDSYQELADFRREHLISRPAHAVIQPMSAWAIFFVAWLLESSLNTLFLRVNDPYGLLGGFIAAAVIAAVNVGVSALIGGSVWPYVHHRSTRKRYVGYVAGVLWLAGMLLWNFLAAHFRDAKASGQPAPEKVALELLRSAPMQLDCIYSYGLLIAGVAFACIAAYTAYRMNDPYPGYGAISDRHSNRCDAYSDEIELAFAELKETRDDAVSTANSIREGLGIQFRERGQIIAARDSHRNRYREHQEYLETIGNTLMGYYRAANLRARTDGRTPASFNKRWHLTRSELPHDVDDPGIEAEVGRCEHALRRLIESVNTTYVEAIESFDHLDKIQRSLVDA
jgi:hypothetical protein